MQIHIFMSVIKGTKTKWKLISLSKRYSNFLYFVYVSQETRILIKRFVVKLHTSYNFLNIKFILIHGWSRIANISNVPLKNNEISEFL